MGLELVLEWEGVVLWWIAEVVAWRQTVPQLPCLFPKIGALSKIYVCVNHPQ